MSLSPRDALPMTNPRVQQPSRHTFRPFHSWPRLLVATVLTASCESPGAEVAAAGATRDSAGVSIIERGGDDRPLALEPVPGAELAPPDSALTAVPWGVSADPATGQIYAIDWRSPRLVAFDSTGRYLSSFGREGGGPGEFRNPVATYLERDGTVVVWDAGRSMLSRWSPAGELLGEERAPVQYWGPGFAVRDGEVITVTTEEDRSGARMIQRLVAASRGGEPRTLSELNTELGMMRIGSGAMPAPKIFAPSLTWAAHGDRVYVLNGPGYRIDVFEDGELTRSIRRNVPPTPVSREMAVEAVESGLGPYGAFMRRANITADQIVSSVGHEEVTSPVQSIAVDPAGRLWVTRTTDGIRPSRIDVMSADGAYEGSLDIRVIPVAFLSVSEFVALQVQPESNLVRLVLHRLSGSGANGG